MTQAAHTAQARRPLPPPWPAWKKTDLFGLVRHLDESAERRVNIGAERLALERAGRRQEIVEAIYETLSSWQPRITYDHEAFSWDDREQPIRRWQEILTGSGRATCLDLAMLVSSICLGNNLMPYIILTDTHAYAAVNVKHGRKPGPREFPFRLAEAQDETTPLTSPDPIRRHVEAGTLIAIECTGLAHSTQLPPDSYEGHNRRDGRLSFSDALAAGRDRLFDDADSVRFVLDATVAADDWGYAPPPPADIRSGSFTLAHTPSGTVAQPAAAPARERTRPRPLRPTWDDFPTLHDRLEQQGLVRKAINAGEQLVAFRGEQDLGKSVLLRRLAHGDYGTRFVDGVVTVNASRLSRADLLQQVHSLLFPTDPPVMATDKELEDLEGADLLLLIDDVPATWTAEDMSEVQKALSRATILIATAAVLPGIEKTGLGPLPPDDGLALFADTYLEGSSDARLIDLDRDAARLICKSVGFHPGRIVDRAHQARSQRAVKTLAEFAGIDDAAPETPAETLTGAMGDAQTACLQIFVALGGGPVPEGVLSAECDSMLGQLEELGVIERKSPRYGLTGALAAGLAEYWPAQWPEDLVAATAHWSRRAPPEIVLADQAFVMAVLEGGVATRQWNDVLALAWAVERVLANATQWDAWRQTLICARTAAAALGDEKSEARAIHQLATRHLGLGEREQARELLLEAAEIRERIGDEEGAAATHHNLRLAPTLLMLAVSTVFLLAVLTSWAGFSFLPLVSSELEFEAVAPWAITTAYVEYENRSHSAFDVTVAVSDGDIDAFCILSYPPEGVARSDPKFDDCLPARSEEAAGPASGGHAIASRAGYFALPGSPLALAADLETFPPCRVEPDGKFELGSREKCQLRVAFQPRMEGSFSASLDYTVTSLGTSDNGRTHGVDVQLKGRAEGPIKTPTTSSVVPPPLNAEIIISLDLNVADDRVVFPFHVEGDIVSVTGTSKHRQTLPTGPSEVSLVTPEPAGWDLVPGGSRCLVQPAQPSIRAAPIEIRAGPQTFDYQPGDVIECTIKYETTAVEVRLLAIPNMVIDFTGLGAPFSLTNGGSMLVPGLNQAAYTIDAHLPPGWELRSTTCSGSEERTSAGGIESLLIDLTGARRLVSCTFEVEGIRIADVESEFFELAGSDTAEVTIRNAGSRSFTPGSVVSGTIFEVVSNTCEGRELSPLETCVVELRLLGSGPRAVTVDLGIPPDVGGDRTVVLLGS